MRLWTLHPKHLDPAGLVALWREGLLAQAVLLGRTRGYTKHPQLFRFHALTDPVGAITRYLLVVQQEAASRGYSFDPSRINSTGLLLSRVPETRGQLLYEWSHLGRKLASRNPGWYALHHQGEAPTAHPLFRIVPGKVRSWEHPTRKPTTSGV